MRGAGAFAVNVWLFSIADSATCIITIINIRLKHLRRDLGAMRDEQRKLAEAVGLALRAAASGANAGWR